MSNRLAADQVGAGFDAHEGDLVGRLFLDRRTELFQVEVSFERIVALRNQAFLVDQLDHFPTQPGNVRLCRRKMEIHQREHARLHEGFRQNVLSRTALVCRQHVVHAEHFLDGGLQPVPRLTAGVAVVGDAHRGHLQVGHRIDARIGDHVHINVAVLEKECIVARFLNGPETFSDREQIEFLNDTYLVHFQRNLVLGDVKFDWHLFLFFEF